MSVEGRISVDVLFHDTDGTAAINVLSLAKAEGYSGGSVQYFSGTAGTAVIVLGEGGLVLNGNVYRNAAGQTVETLPRRIAFSWNGDTGDVRQLLDVDAYSFVIASRNGEVAVTSCSGNVLEMSACGSTGTYTLVVYGE